MNESKGKSNESNPNKLGYLIILSMLFMLIGFICFVMIFVARFEPKEVIDSVTGLPPVKGTTNPTVSIQPKKYGEWWGYLIGLFLAIIAFIVNNKKIKTTE